MIMPRRDCSRICTSQCTIFIYCGGVRNFGTDCVCNIFVEYCATRLLRQLADSGGQACNKGRLNSALCLGSYVPWFFGYWVLRSLPLDYPAGELDVLGCVGTDERKKSGLG